MKIEVTDKYLSGTNTKEGDVVRFLDEGSEGNIKGFDGKPAKVVNFNVLLNHDKELTYTPNGKSLRMLIEALGDDGEDWVNATFIVHLVSVEVKGVERSVIRPVNIVKQTIPKATEEEVN